MVHGPDVSLVLNVADRQDRTGFRPARELIMRSPAPDSSCPQSQEIPPAVIKVLTCGHVASRNPLTCPSRSIARFILDNDAALGRPLAPARS
jgi:hypothetical protein